MTTPAPTANAHPTPAAPDRPGPYTTNGNRPAILVCDRRSTRPAVVNRPRSSLVPVRPGRTDRRAARATRPHRRRRRNSNRTAVAPTTHETGSDRRGRLRPERPQRPGPKPLSHSWRDSSLRRRRTGAPRRRPPAAPVAANATRMRPVGQDALRHQQRIGQDRPDQRPVIEDRSTHAHGQFSQRRHQPERGQQPRQPRPT